LLVNFAEVVPSKGHVPKRDIIASFRKYEEIEEIIEVQAFNFDLVLKARLQSLKQLSALIEEFRSIEGIEELSSAIITEETLLPPSITFKRSD